MVTILSLALLVVVAWLSVDLYKAFSQTPPPVVSVKDLEPVAPGFDKEVLKDLQERANHYR